MALRDYADLWLGGRPRSDTNHDLESRSKRTGFTLVELLLVVLVLAVLAYLAVPAIAQTVRNSRMRTCAANEATAEKVIWLWYANGRASGKVAAATSSSGISLRDLDMVLEGGSPDPTNDWPELAAGFTGGAEPRCPFTGNAAYVVDIEADAQGRLVDVFVYCNDAVAPGAGNHPRAADRRGSIDE